MRTSAILFIASSLFAGCVGDAPLGEDGEPILSGRDDAGDPAVGMIRVVTNLDLFGTPTYVNLCTATLIAPQIMLTAGHCQLPGLWTDVTFESQPDLFANAGSPEYIPATVIKSPLYDGNSANGHDVSIVILGWPIATTPIRRGPTPADYSVVRSVGYGHNTFAQTGAGIKRTANLPVEDVSGVHEFVAGVEGDNVCHGDSGGPVLQGGKTVGVASYVDTSDCHGSGHFMRLEDNLAFIHIYAPGF
jgi:hypothetical protein